MADVAVQATMRLALATVAPKLVASVTEHEAGTVFEALLASCDEEQRIAVTDGWVSRIHNLLFVDVTVNVTTLEDVDKC